MAYFDLSVLSPPGFPTMTSEHQDRVDMAIAAAQQMLQGTRLLVTLPGWTPVGEIIQRIMKGINLSSLYCLAPSAAGMQDLTYASVFLSAVNSNRTILLTNIHACTRKDGSSQATGSRIRMVPPAPPPSATFLVDGDAAQNSVLTAFKDQWPGILFIRRPTIGGPVRVHRLGRPATMTPRNGARHGLSHTAHWLG